MSVSVKKSRFLSTLIITRSTHTTHARARQVHVHIPALPYQMAARDVIFIRELLADLAIVLACASNIFSDSKSAVGMAYDPVSFKKTKHILRAAEFLRDLVARGVISLSHVAGRHIVRILRGGRKRDRGASKADACMSEAMVSSGHADGGAYEWLVSWQVGCVSGLFWCVFLLAFVAVRLR